MELPDADFASIAARIRSNVLRQGFMTHVGAEISDMTCGSCELSVDRRPELLQQNGFVHGGVLAYLADNALTYAGGSVLGGVVGGGLLGGILGGDDD